MDMVRARLGNWKSKYLSMDGWVVLIRSVLSSILVYQMLVNVMLEGVRRKLYGLFSRFLWGGSENKRKMHLVDRESVTALVVQGGVRLCGIAATIWCY